MFIKIIYLLYSISITKIIIIYAQSTEPIIEKSSSSICFNNTDCDVSESTNDLASTNTTQINSEDAGSKIQNPTVNVTTVVPLNTTLSSISTTSTPKATISTIRNPDEICGCDITVNSCDINCCCDVDCKGFNVTEFFSCKDEHPRIYDARYCHDSNYIQHNNSRYLLEKLRDNLFCIVVDNLPPIYSIDYDPIISNRNVLNEIIGNNKKSKFKWDQRTTNIKALFNTENPYRYGDIIWKIENSYIKKLEIPQSGFTSICSLKKNIKYLEEWKNSCMQILLENNNAQLFTNAFNNFTVIASPILYNNSNFTSDNQICPTAICIPVESHYCSDSWISCKNESSRSGNCRNGTCRDIVRGVRFVITHSGVKGINKVEVYFKLGNASEKFYQEYQIKYKWYKEDESEIFHLSGNPGYIPGKPIIVGNLIKNKTNGGDYSYISVNKDEPFLSLPVGKIDGKCSEDLRYGVNFGEDLKLGCTIELKTSNFSTYSCADLQNRIIDSLLRDILSNVTQVDEHLTYIAKWNYIDNKNGVNDWVKIMFDRIPQNILTGRLIDDQLMCSGLVTSLRIDIVHRHLPDPKIMNNYKILGVAVTFSEDSDIYWDKCETDSCLDVLSVNIISYVIFHDVSQPSKYFFAEGPNLDITLPHDFFYPFINNSPIILNFNSYFVVLSTCVFLPRFLVIL